MPIIFLLLLAGGIALIWYTNRLDRETSARLIAHTSPSDTTDVAAARALAIRYMDEVATRKRASSAQHLQFATDADARHAPATANLFRALAHADRLHEWSCAEAINNLGGTYRSPSTSRVIRLATPEEALRYTRDRLCAQQAASCDAISDLLHHGHRYAARQLAHLSDCERRQVELITARLQGADTTGGYILCPACGLLLHNDPNICSCPSCLTPSWRFVRFVPHTPASAHPTATPAPDQPAATHAAPSAAAMPAPTAR